MADFMAHTVVGDGNKDVLLLQQMLEESEREEREFKERKKAALAGEIFEEAAEDETTAGPSGGLGSWLDEISEKDKQLRRAQEAGKPASADRLPPVRNTIGREKKVQVGPSDIEKQKASQKSKEGTGEGAKTGPSKHQKYYQYDYFKEWDKFDVDSELKRLEEEEKQREEHAKFAKKTADPFEDVQKAAQEHDPSMTYHIDDMTPLERKMAAQREKEKGNECMQCGETNAAVAYYSKSLELSPGNHLVLGNRAQAYIGIHCFLQAEMDCDQALAIEPSYHKARYRRAVACKEQGKFEEAINDLEIVVKEDQSSKAAVKLLEECKIKWQARKVEAEKKQKAEEERKRYEAAPRRKIAIQEVDEDDEDDGLDKGAMEQARQSVRLKKQEEERLLKLDAARRKKDEGNNAVKKKDFTGAIRLYTSALKVLPDGDKEESYLILSNRAHVYLQCGEHDLAEADCTEALAVNPSWAKARHRRGVARSALGKYNEALEDLEAALKLEGDSKHTMDEIKRVRQLQAEKRREEAALKKPPTRIQIEEIDDSDSEEEIEAKKGSPKHDTDSSDEDVIVINKLSAQESPSRVKRVPIVEVDDDDEEGCIIDDDSVVTSAPPATRQNVKLGYCRDTHGSQGAKAADPKIDKVTSDIKPSKEEEKAPSPTKRIQVQIIDSDSDDETDIPPAAVDKSKTRSPKVDKDAPAIKSSMEEKKAPSPTKRVQVQIIESDSDDESDNGEKEETEPTPEPVLEEKVAIPWEVDGRDEQRLSRAKVLKDEADGLFKKGLFEHAAEVYGKVLEVLGHEEEYLREAVLCYNNRAACRLQIRDYGATIADCMEVLSAEEHNIKALVRRGLAYEGLERYSKAAADCREVLSLEYAAGGGLSTLGQKARECLERCKKHDPEIRSIPIPVKPSTTGRRSSSDQTALASKVQEVAKEHNEAPKAPAAKAPAKDSKDIHAGSAVEGKTPTKEAAAKRVDDVKNAEEQQKLEASGQDVRREAAVREANACKERGNEAFKAGKYHNAIMHYSAAIDLVDDDPAFYTNLAATHYALKDYNNALRMAEKTLKLDDNNAKGHFRKGQALDALGKLGEAEAAYAAGLAILPNSEQLKTGLKSVRDKLRAKEMAEADALAKIKENKKQEEVAKAEEDKKRSAQAAKPLSPSASNPQIISSASTKKALADNNSTAVTANGFKKQCKVLKKDTAALYAYLRTVPAAGLGKLLVSGIDEDELVPVLRALEQHGLTADPSSTFELLQGISRIPRVGIICKMLDRKDGKMLESMLLRLHPAKAVEGGNNIAYTTEDWAAARQALGV